MCVRCSIVGGTVSVVAFLRLYVWIFGRCVSIRFRVWSSCACTVVLRVLFLIIDYCVLI